MSYTYTYRVRYGRHIWLRSPGIYLIAAVFNHWLWTFQRSRISQLLLFLTFYYRWRVITWKHWRMKHPVRKENKYKHTCLCETFCWNSEPFILCNHPYRNVHTRTWHDFESYHVERHSATFNFVSLSSCSPCTMYTSSLSHIHSTHLHRFLPVRSSARIG